MSESSSVRDVQIRGGGTRQAGARENFSAALVLLILMRTSQVLASDQASLEAGPLKPQFKSRPDSTQAVSALTPPLFDLPNAYRTPEPVMNELQATGDFRPRGRSVLERDAQVAVFQDAPMLRSTNMWQRLSDYRAHGRVRLLTLWETAGSSVSLQAGRKGEPSLQWTSRSMNHGGASRGLFDQLLPGSMRSDSRSHPPLRPISTDPTTKPTKPSDIAMMGPIK